MDTDRDSLPDWTAIVDGKLSTSLIAFDDDIDGDGKTNILDENPFVPYRHKKRSVIKGEAM